MTGLDWGQVSRHFNSCFKIPSLKAFLVLNSEKSPWIMNIVMAGCPC